MVRSAARRTLPVARRYGDDALAYFTERLDPAPTRAALVGTVRQAKRNKAFETGRWIGLALDGTGAGRGRAEGCEYCHPRLDAAGHVRDYLHHCCVVSVVGVGLTLPIDVEPPPPGDSEYGAGQRLLQDRKSVV